MISTLKLGVKRKPEFIQMRPVCVVCKKGKYKRDFRLKNGKPTEICRGCRKTRPRKKASLAQNFESLRLGIFTILKNQKLKNKEVTKVAELRARDYAMKLTNLPNKIATILGKTYVVRGDDASLSDDEALIRIRDLIDDVDPKLIARNLKKRLP